VSYEKLLEISHLFDPSLAVHITQRKQVDATPSPYTQTEILSTLKKRPLTPEDITILFDEKSQLLLQKLLKEGKIIKTDNNGVFFYKIP